MHLCKKQEEKYVAGPPPGVSQINQNEEVPNFHILAHALKHPVTILKAMLQSAEAPDFEAIQTVCLRQVERLNQMINSFLAQTKTGKTSKESINLNEGLLEILEFLEPFYGSRSIEQHRDFSPIPNIAGDRSALNHALFNLILNAIEAIEQKGAITLQTREIHHFGQRKVELIIQDDGTGIAREEIDKIFTPYYSTKEPGRGLGLWIAKQIIEEQGGEIEVASHPGMGTLFWIRFPIVLPTSLNKEGI